MKVFTTALCLGAFLVFIGLPGKILADFPPPGPHEVFNSCGLCMENNCAEPYLEDNITCPPMCNMKNYCVDGYIRQYPNGPCILPSECPKSKTN